MNNKEKILTISLSGVGAFSVVFISLFIWKAVTSNTHVVSFETNGGSHINSIKVKNGERVSKPEDPIKDDYTFDAWFTNPDFTGSGYDFNKPVTKDITLYAQWFNASNSITITFDAGKNNLVEGKESSIFAQSFKVGSSYKDVIKSVNNIGGIKEGQEFLRWTIGGAAISDDYIFNSNTRLEAIYAPVRNDCLTITAHSDNLSLKLSYKNELKILNDEGEWELTTSKPVILEHAGDQIYIKRELSTRVLGDYFEEKLIFATKPFSVSGPIESLINNVTGDETPEYAFCRCFEGCFTLSSAKNLMIKNTTMSNNCFDNMFLGCSMLNSAPELPATTLANGCYCGMFNGCSSLSSTPKLLSESLAEGCYQEMFRDCASLTDVPMLPAKTLFAECYKGMFSGCKSLISLPSGLLPASILCANCYNEMFRGCSSLAVVPDDLLTVTEMSGEGSCAHMFDSCSSLNVVPNLPCELLEDGCYAHMFDGCSSLTTVPIDLLPASTLKVSCYEYMFSGCKSLVTPPNLPAEMPVQLCYWSMFDGCISLASAPELPNNIANTNMCYATMFFGCESLKITENSGDHLIFTPNGDTSDGCINMFSYTSNYPYDMTPTSGTRYYWNE